jgi:hypothetical protein
MATRFHRPRKVIAFNVNGMICCMKPGLTEALYILYCCIGANFIQISSFVLSEFSMPDLYVDGLEELYSNLIFWFQEE